MTETAEEAERIHRLNSRLEALEGHGHSSDRLVSAVVGVRHDPRSLRIDSRVYRERDAAVLARSIMEATEAANQDVDRQARELSGTSSRDGDEDPFLRALDEIAGLEEGR